MDKLKKFLHLFLFFLILATPFFTKSVYAYENTAYRFTIDLPSMWDFKENTVTSFLLVSNFGDFLFDLDVIIILAIIIVGFIVLLIIALLLFWKKQDSKSSISQLDST